jgi:hypothetical protein
MRMPAIIRPTLYRDRSKGDQSGEWKQPTQQDLEVELLQSVEHRRRPAVFGTAGP